MESVSDCVEWVIKRLSLANETDYIGESVSQLEHALQCAYFAEQAGHCEAVILASLLHDIGHFAAPLPQVAMSDLGMIHHEWIGAKLAYDMGLSTQVALLIGYHVTAKRYLAGKKPAYYEKLSAASKQTLAFQGGPMTFEEIIQFERHRYYKEILQVRINDEKAKQIGLSVPDIHYYEPRLAQHISNNRHERCTLDDELPLTQCVDDTWAQNCRALLDAAHDTHQ